jgi:hypothetical protein
MWGWLIEARTLALCARQPLGIAGEFSRQRLERDVSLESRVVGTVHLAIPPAPSRLMISYGPSRVPV